MSGGRGHGGRWPRQAQYCRLCPSPGRVASDVPEEDRVRSLPRYRPAHAGSGGFNAAVYLFWLICGASRLLLPRARPQEP